jgi:hypothetical protein
MDVIELLITIVVVTILVTIVLAVVTYVAYKLRLAREPSALGSGENGPRYFVEYRPPDGGGGRGHSGDRAEAAEPVREKHAT